MVDKSKLQNIYDENLKRDNNILVSNACHNSQAFRLIKEDKKDVRSHFAIDRDRILYSGAYRRYQGKTQVFSFTNMIDEEMSNRSLHTTYVSQISRTIGKALSLNTELIEAVALGHDLGHTPFGHDGERALSELCVKYKVGKFFHNIESLHIVDNISSKGKGLNLTFQVRDGIISHDGEVHNTQLVPNFKKTEADILSYIEKKKSGKKVQWMPATLEGCVVRISDTIAYIGQDIEDAIRFNLLKRDKIPDDCQKYLGTRNSQIVDSLVSSVILNSHKKDFIAFDEDTSFYLQKLKAFNYKYIYTNSDVKKSLGLISKSMVLLFEKYLQDIDENNTNSKIFQHFLNHKSKKYLESFVSAEKVRDFIATMTDRYFNEEVKDYLLPGRFL
ncbi:MAG: HD domain-containing protein [Candidatus Cloacimonadota bacterium]|nr:HD domain-containing protein [Candidatus Cloacimonadota bacterium]